MSDGRCLAASAALLLAWQVAACVPDHTEIDDVACPQGGTDLTYENFGQGFLGAYCQRCHGSAAEDRNGAPEAYVFDSQADVLEYQDRIFVRAAGPNTTMPPGPDDPPRDERDLLAEWLACGAP